MKILPTKFQGVFEIEPTIFKDERGFFYESFRTDRFEEATGLTANFVQDNHSKSSKGVLRGLHFQTGAAAQAKLVRVIAGSVQDVIVDLREGSATYGDWDSYNLSATNFKQLYVPRGFAHGFLTLEDNSELLYKCDNYYSKAADGGIYYNGLGIDWQLPQHQLLLSEKDRQLPKLEEIAQELSFS
jgi:dTDP-4-dehydrorhamnose 3,5-epimerase